MHAAGRTAPLAGWARIVLFGLAALAGCSWLSHTPPVEERVNLIAVMPIEREEAADAASAERRPGIKAGAQRVITAEIYSVLANSSKWRFVPDLTVVQTLPKISTQGSLLSRARELGTAVKADAVLFGTVSRYKERIGGEYGAQEPASVAFTLSLVSVPTGKILWTGNFDQTQQPLSSNLLNWWQFWRGGPRWFSAEEFTRLGVERLLDDLSDKLGID